MPAPISTYDPANVQVIIDAVPVSGFADGTFVSVSQDNESFTKKVGADGEVARARMSNRSGTLTLTLMATSVANAALTALHLAETIFSISIIDGGNEVFGAQCWVEKPPTVDRGTEISDSEWTIAIAQVVFGLEGNPG